VTIQRISGRAGGPGGLLLPPFFDVEPHQLAERHAVDLTLPHSLS
jgi:hypothetical protein